MQLIGAAGQQRNDPLFDASGTSTGAAQLLLPQQKQRSLLLIQNISDTVMYIEFGSARATATLTSGVVTSCTVTNGGFGFTIPPRIEFLGGGHPGNSTYLGATEPFAQSPSKPAQAHCVLSGGAVSSIVVDDGGSGYAIAPYVYIRNSLNDPNGCASPSATSGLYLAANGGSFFNDGTACTTDPVALFCSVGSKAFTVKFMG